jgi:hypothetical protein
MSEPEPDVDHGASESSLPQLDTVDSRWWYWIAAYPVAMLVSIPIMVVAMLLFIVPAFVVGVEPQPGPGSWGFITLIGVVLGLLMMVVIVAAFALAVLFPVALYFDARAVSEADVDWHPDPLLYGLLGLLQLIVTPLIGFFISIYYLYQRHEHVGVP